jgi:hypothetical protein
VDAVELEANPVGNASLRIAVGALHQIHQIHAKAATPKTHLRHSPFNPMNAEQGVTPFILQY